MKYSEHVENFLNFLREAQREYNIAADDEKSANGATQDILHSIELEEHKYHEYARLSKALREVRQERRRAKDIEQQEISERLAVISRLIPILKQTAELAGFEVVGRITLRDKETGKEYK